MIPRFLTNLQKAVQTLVLTAGLCAGGGEATAAPLERWIYLSTNLQNPQNVVKAEALFARGAATGFTHVLLTDSKFSKLEEVPVSYRENCAEVQRAAAKHGITIVPALFGMGYSNEHLVHNPHLAEGLPVKEALFVVYGGEARIVADPPVSLPGTKRENLREWKFADGTLVSEDDTLKATEPGGSARFHAPVPVAKFRQYTVSVRTKTLNFTGKPDIKVLGNGQKPLSFTTIDVKSTQDWTSHNITFNSLDHDEVGVYLGTWGPARGTVWWKDAQIHEEGLRNVLRRDGCPLTVTNEDASPLKEGIDFEPVTDLRMGNPPSTGKYDAWHEPPPLRTKLPDGTRLRVSFYHPHSIHNGQMCICPSEPETIDILRKQAQTLHELWDSDAYMMLHDEWRVLGWDAACQRRGLTPGELVADNVRTCQDILAKTAPGARIYVWSDMFDPHHNAVKDYYLVNGDLHGSCEGLKPSVVIVNWNSGQPERSPAFFSGRGHPQILAGFYDSDPAAIKPWLSAAQKVPGLIGVMYTTWENDYSQLETFARWVSEAEEDIRPAKNAK